jgi:uncharacterized protein YaeQ
LNAHKLQTVCRGDGTLGFGGGLSTPDEADVILRDYTARPRVWIEVGQPDDKPIAKACGLADEVIVYAYSNGADIWWRGIEGKLARIANLSVWRVAADASQALAQLAQRTMQLQATVHESLLTMGDGARTVDIEPARLK